MTEQELWNIRWRVHRDRWQLDPVACIEAVEDRAALLVALDDTRATLDHCQATVSRQALETQDRIAYYLMEERTVENQPKQPQPVPSIGRIVHQFSMGSPGGEYVGGQPRAAIVTAVLVPGDPESPLSLCVITPQGFFFDERVKFSADNKPGCWNWPPFVPPVPAK